MILLRPPVEQLRPPNPLQLFLQLELVDEKDEDDLIRDVMGSEPTGAALWDDLLARWPLPCYGLGW